MSYQYLVGKKESESDIESDKQNLPHDLVVKAANLSSRILAL